MTPQRMYVPIGAFLRSLSPASRCMVLWSVLLLSSVVHAAPRTDGESLADALAGAALDDGLRQSGQALLDEAQAHGTARLQAVEASAALRAAKAAWPAKVRALEKQLAEDPRAGLAAWARRISAETDIDTLERVLAGERITLETLRAEEDRLADELTDMLTAPVEAAGTIISLRQELEGIDAEASGGDAPSGVIDRIRAYRNAAWRQRLEAEIERASLEQDTLDQRQRLAELELQMVRASRQTHATRLAHVESVIVTRGEAELAALMRSLEADVLRHGAPERLDHAAVLARDNLALGRELAGLSEALTGERASLTALQLARDDVENALRASTARIELGGSSEAVGRWLWSERRRLVAPARLQKRLDEIRGQLADLKLREVMIAEQRRQGLQLAVDGQAPGQAAEQEVADPEAAHPVPEADLAALSMRRAEVLERLQGVLQRRGAVLETMDGVIAVQHARTLELRSLQDRHLLWTRSHGAVDGEWFDRTVAGLRDLVRPGRYGKTLDLVWRNFLEHPFRWILSLALLGLLIVLRYQAVARIEAEGRVTRQVREDSYRATARAFAWTVIAALPFPVAFCLAGILLRQVGQPGNFSDSMGIGLLSMGAPFFFTQLVRFAAIERGLGHAHFRWRRARCETLRRWMPTFNWVVLPLWFVVAMSVARNLDLAADVAARIAVVLASLVIAWGAWNVFAAGRLWVVRGVEIEPSWWRKATRTVCTLFPVGIGLLAIAGWVHSASVLLQAVLASVSAAVCIAVLVGLLSRWMLLGERRLAFRRAMEQSMPADSEGGVAPEPEGEVTLQQVNEQTGRLVRALRLALIAVAFVWVWADVLPAISRLDEFALWHVEDSGPDGEGGLLPITVIDGLAGVFILLLTWAAARNLPGLVEIGLLSRTRIDAPTRYAITSILRYTIVIAGMFLGLAMLGMRWGQLQWMVAALTVGLGFGLQEIFANFVSGIILLFERPFRVGDVITVGEYTGTVNRIRTRATTIVDFDNREIVVPNKSFITGQLTNWTLTDTVTRMTVRIGVDYGTDPALVHRLLLQAAREVPEVMRNPEPRTWFLSFGASSLDFELRVFVASVNDRLVVQNALHTRINALLMENGIEIAYPHLNVNLRQLPPVGG